MKIRDITAWHVQLFDAHVTILLIRYFKNEWKRRSECWSSNVIQENENGAWKWSLFWMFKTKSRLGFDPQWDFNLSRLRRWLDWFFYSYWFIIFLGKHRSLGTHLSFVRSINMDSWTDLQLASMRYGGNVNAQLFFSKYFFSCLLSLN